MNSEYLNELSEDQFAEERSMPNPDTARLEVLERQFDEAANALYNR